MRAHPGGWLIIKRGDIDHPARRGRIEEVRAADGAPPYRVRWLDTGRVALVFPGRDAQVLTRAELDRADAAAADRFTAVQREFARGV